jgi:hypothetical protein
MTKRLARTLPLAAAVAVAAAFVVPVGTAAAEVSQTPVATGCPSGWERLSVAFLESQGPYQLPRRIDTAGNNNGFVCAHAYPEAARRAMCGPPCPVPVLYQFQDDDNPAHLHAQVGG